MKIDFPNPLDLRLQLWTCPQIKEIPLVIIQKTYLVSLTNNPYSVIVLCNDLKEAVRDKHGWNHDGTWSTHRNLTKIVTSALNQAK